MQSVASLESTRSPCCWFCHSGPWSSVCLSWRCYEDVSAACSPFYCGMSENGDKTQTSLKEREKKNRIFWIFRNISELSLDAAENQMCMWGNSCKNITILSCLHVSRCGDLRSTWETCGSGIQPCWACQRCWSGDRCWHPSCSLLQARCHRALAPGPQKVRAEWTNWEGERTRTFLTRQRRPQHIRSPSLPLWDVCILCMVKTRSPQHQLWWGGSDWA